MDEQGSDRRTRRNEQKRKARMAQREAKVVRLDNCAVCGEMLPAGSRLDRCTCSDRCRQEKRRQDAKDRKRHVRYLTRAELPEPDAAGRPARAVAEIEFDTNLAVERLAARRHSGVVNDEERVALRREAEEAYDRRARAEEARVRAGREAREAYWRDKFG